MSFGTAILAAGLGKRLKSSTPKVLHRLAGEPLLIHVLNTASAFETPVHVIVGHGAEQVASALPESVNVVHQGEPRGTGHALQMLLEQVSDLQENLLVLSGDVPLISVKTLKELISSHHESEACLTVLTCELNNPGHYGRILRNEEGEITGIRECKDASTDELAIHEINTGTYLFSLSLLRDLLPGLNNDNAQGEIYLTDLIGKAAAKGLSVEGIKLLDAREMQGVNTRQDLALVHRYYFELNCDRLMDSGVTIVDPLHTYIDHRTRVGEDTVIHPGVVLKGTTVGDRCEIHPYCVISECEIGDENVVLPSSVLSESRIGNECSIGPFAHLRPGCRLGNRVRFGNFVEGKKAHLEDGAKAGHLSYLGDCSLGKNVNIGCGTITCNYDGKEKHQTIIGEDVFVGSDTQFVAPVTVGKGAYIGAGSTITQDVPEHALAVARARQRNIKNWAKKKEKI